MTPLVLLTALALAQDSCPDDPNKTEPGLCGCGVFDSDWDNDSTSDSCIDPAATVDTSVLVGFMARVDANATVGAGSSLGARSHVGADALVGTNCAIGRAASVGQRTDIGHSTVLMARSSLGDDVRILAPGQLVLGPRAFVGAGAVIGSSSVLSGRVVVAGGVVAGHRVHVGRESLLRPGVVLGNDVVLGPAVSVAAATTVDDDTAIRRGSFIGEGSTIGTGVRIGRDVTLAHHTRVGDFAWIRADVTGEPWAQVAMAEGVIRGSHLPAGNAPPSAPAIEIRPVSPKTADNLVCTILSPGVDPDGDTVTYDYRWFKNSTLTGFETDTVPFDQTAPGQVWICEVTATDGDLFADPVTALATVAQQVDYHYTGSDQSLVVPEGATSVQAKLWGGAGGGGNAEGYQHTGGAGGYVSGTIPVSPGDVLTIKVGRGGDYSTGFGYAAWPNGGHGSVRGGYYTGGGGGRSVILVNGAEYMLAGGGGGAGGTGWSCGHQLCNGGGGGGATGGNGRACPQTGSCYGKGGSQSAGGAGGCTAHASTNEAGGRNQGAHGGTFRGTTRGNENSGGGGGDGYFGGSSGTVHAGGGGGSSYLHPSVTDRNMPGPSSSANPPNSGDGDRQDSAGTARNANTGHNGFIVLWVQ